eukprot:TRINITY_DN70388_c0_g1_i1.p1 TRINITY_DN70388_c0_g1~~TRINITY_DN70388_c0_g1_i1.p1  ORF type:complete len:120 (-),score=31.38 TRINITY_DN70388_c0_g1_i1:37-396(-)
MALSSATHVVADADQSDGASQRSANVVGSVGIEDAIVGTSAVEAKSSGGNVGQGSIAEDLPLPPPPAPVYARERQKPMLGRFAGVVGSNGVEQFGGVRKPFFKTVLAPIQCAIFGCNCD